MKLIEFKQEAKKMLDIGTFGPSSSLSEDESDSTEEHDEEDDPSFEPDSDSEAEHPSDSESELESRSMASSLGIVLSITSVGGPTDDSQFSAIVVKGVAMSAGTGAAWVT